MMKRILTVVVLVAWVMMISVTTVAAASMRVIADGAEIRFDETLPVVDDSTYVPLSNDGYNKTSF